MRVRKAKLKGIFSSQAEASEQLNQPGDLALVERGVPRLLVMDCPDGCGEKLRINLDKRAGKAWRVYQDVDGFSLYPSVWRDTGCESHFIIWNSKIFWNDGRDSRVESAHNSQLNQLIVQALDSSNFRTAEDIANEIGAVPWSVSRVAEDLFKLGKLEQKTSNLVRLYRLRAS